MCVRVEHRATSNALRTQPASHLVEGGCIFICVSVGAGTQLFRLPVWFHHRYNQHNNWNCSCIATHLPSSVFISIWNSALQTSSLIPSPPAETAYGVFGCGGSKESASNVCFYSNSVAKEEMCSWMVTACSCCVHMPLQTRELVYTASRISLNVLCRKLCL